MSRYSPSVAQRGPDLSGLAQTIQSVFAQRAANRRLDKKDKQADEDRTRSLALQNFQLGQQGVHLTRPGELPPAEVQSGVLEDVSQSVRRGMEPKAPSPVMPALGGDGPSFDFQSIVQRALEPQAPQGPRYDIGQGYYVDRNEAAANAARGADIAGRSEFQKAIFNALPGVLTKRDPTADHRANRLFDVEHPLPTTAATPAPHFQDTSKGIMVWNPKTGKLEPTGEMPFVKPTQASPANERQERNAERQTVQGLQRDYQQNPTIKSAYGIADATRSIKAGLGGQSPMDDLSLIYSTVKLFDPNAVKEGEIVLFTSGVSVPQQLKSMVQKWNTGKRLLPEQRQHIQRLVDAKIAEQQKSVAPIQEDFGQQARRWNVTKDSAFIAPDPFRGVHGGAQSALPQLTPVQAQRANADPDYKAFLQSKGYQIP